MDLQQQSDPQTPPARSPDDRLAPVLLAIWGLAAYVWAIDCLILHPDPAELGRRWPWTTGIVAALASIVSIAVVTIAPHRLRRGMLLALCLSLVINLSVLVALSYIHISSRPIAARTKTSPTVPPEEPPPSESFPLNLDEPEEAPVRDEQRPVPTGQPELEPRELPRPAHTVAAVTLPERAESLPEPQPRPSLASVTRQELIESPPRRFEWQSRLSRQPLSAQPSLGPGDAETYLVPRTAIDLSPREADSPLPRQAATSPERPAMIEQPADSPTTPPQIESPPRAATEDLASAVPPLESLQRLENRSVDPSALNPSGRPLSDSRVESPPRPEDPSPAPASPRAARLEPRSTLPPLNPEADEPAVSTARLEPPQAPARRSGGQVPPAEPLTAASMPRRPETPALPPASATPIEVPDRSPGRSNERQLVDQPQPARLESPMGARAEQAALPATEIDAAPAEMASARAIEPAVARVASREQPEVGSIARGRIAPLRSRPGVAQTDLPSEVVRPDVPPSAPVSDVATAGAVSLDERPAANSTNWSQPEEATSSMQGGAPEGLAAPPPRLPDRSADTADEAPSTPGLGAPALPRSQSLADASPIATPDTSVPVIDGRTGPVGPEGNPTRWGAVPAAEVDRLPAALATSDFGPTSGAAGPAEDLNATASRSEAPSETNQYVGPATSDLVRRTAEPTPDAMVGRNGFNAPAARPERSRVAVTPSVESSVGVSDIPGPPAGELADSGTPDPADVELRSAGSELVRRSTGAIPVDAAVDAGIGGLADDIPTDIGMAHRRAQPESQQVADNVGRFIRRPLSGPPSLDTQVPIPAPAFETRMNRHGNASVGGQGRPSLRTEAAIELGLTYLSAQQQADGSWRLHKNGEPEEGRRLSVESDAAATGLALLSFLGAGYHHRSEKYGDVVSSGLQFLIDHQQANGDLYIPTDAVSNESAWLYSHAIAGIALCEAYGMTQDPALREPAQRAIDFIVESQHPQRGGWRYQPRVGSDTSVSGWMVMALRSAELANLQVPRDVWRRIDVWLDLAQASPRRPELYRYNPLAPNTPSQGHGRRVTKSMTAVGLLMRMYTGWRRDDREMIDGASYLLANLPEFGTLRDPQRDTYYWYYATQVMFHMRGDYWERWNERLHELLTSTQEQTGELAGSWDPWSPLPDRWSPHAGRLYVTTMNLLSLEVYYRHLPIYEDTAR